MLPLLIFKHKTPRLFLPDNRMLAEEWKNANQSSQCLTYLLQIKTWIYSTLLILWTQIHIFIFSILPFLLCRHKEDAFHCWHTSPIRISFKFSQLIYLIYNLLTLLTLFWNSMPPVFNFILPYSSQSHILISKCNIKKKDGLDVTQSLIWICQRSHLLKI